MTRRAGVLIPLFSLRGPNDWGVGEIPDLVPFARWGHGAGLSVVQILPVNEVSRGQNSPYAALTAFALDPVYLALDQVEDFAGAGGVDALDDDLRRLHRELAASGPVRWTEVRRLKAAATELAYRRFAEQELSGDGPRARAFRAFCAAHAHWLDDYVLYTAIHDEAGGASWETWPAPLAERDPGALAAARARHRDRLQHHLYVQWQLDEQWHAARAGAHALGVELMGDLPFMVAGDSADVWARAGDFRRDARVGVPPDAFSAEGQDWGLPVYRWDVMRENGFAWMRARARRAADLYTLFRVDHVVGLYRTYYRELGARDGRFTPEGEAEQTRLGETVIAILGEHAEVVAEDLGTVPDFVRASLTRLDVPGYRVLRWEQDQGVFRDPAAWPALSVATTGTHDTDALLDWYDALPDHEREALLRLPGLAGADLPLRADDRVRDALLGLVYLSASDLALVPYQDLLGVRDRVNVPGTVSDENWTYRMPVDIATLAGNDALAHRLRELARGSGRA